MLTLYGRQVLQLNELCRRMETIVEQVVPFAPNEEVDPNIVYKEELDMADSPNKAGQGNNNNKKNRNNVPTGPAHQSQVVAQENKSFVPYTDRLSNFYRKYNRILLDNIAISKEKERLEIENAQLQDLIGQYVDGMKISDEILADDNPLFVVNGRYVLCPRFAS